MLPIFNDYLENDYASLDDRITEVMKESEPKADFTEVSLNATIIEPRSPRIPRKRDRKKSGESTDDEVGYPILNEGRHPDAPPKRSEIEVMVSVVRKLAGQIPLEEKAYIEEETNVPVYPKDTDDEGLFLTTQMMQQKIRDWRQNKMRKHGEEKDCDWPKEVQEEWVKTVEMEETLTGLETDWKKRQEEKANAQDLTEEMIAQAQVTEEYDEQGRQIIRYSSTPSTLPYVTCVVQGEKKQIYDETLIDSGASTGILPYTQFTDLGLTEDDLSNPDKYVVSTVSVADDTSVALGDITLNLYLKASNGKYYRIPVKFVVMKAPIRHCIFGWRDLINQNFKWEAKKDGTQVLTLDVMSLHGHKIRRQFITQSYTSQTMMVNMSDIHLKAGKMTKVQMGTKNTPRMEKGFVRFESEHLTIRPTTLRVNKAETYKAKPWPEAKLQHHEVELTALGRQSGTIRKGTLKIPLEVAYSDSHFMEALERVNACFTEHLEMKYKPGHNVDEPECLLPNVEDIIMRKLYLNQPDLTEIVETMHANVSDSSVEKQVDDMLAHCDDREVAAKLKNIVMSKEGTVSRHKYDIGKLVGLPPAKIRPKTDEPWADPLRRYSDEDQRLIQETLDKMEAARIIEKTREPSDHNNPILCVAKPDADRSFVERSKADKKKKLSETPNKRITLDLRTFNDRIHSAAPLYLPRLEELLPRFRNAYCSTIDVAQAFFAVPLDEASRKYTAFYSPGTSTQYQFCRMPMGSKTSPSEFQNRLGKILSEENWERFKSEKATAELLRDHPELKPLRLFDCVKFYLDDIILFNDKLPIHNFLFDFVISMLEKYNLRWSPAKAKILRKRLVYLGHLIDTENNEYYLSEERIQAFKRWSVPTKSEHLVSRLAALSYFSKMLAGLKQVCAVLFLLARSKKPFKFQRCHYHAWEEMLFLIQLNIKQKLVDIDKPLLISSDASFLAVAGNCWQISENKRLDLVASFSKLFSLADLGKSSCYRELIALIMCLNNFDTMIRSCRKRVCIATDCRSLIFLRRLKSVNSRLYSFALFFFDV